MADGARTLLVPKGPRADAAPVEFDRDELIRQLFAMPLPPNPTRTRTYPIDTVLGRIMRLRGLSVNDVAKVDGGPSARQLTDYLSGARKITAEHKAALASGLGIDGRLL